MWSYILVAIFIVIIFYVTYYYKYPKDLAILQTTLSDFHFDMLREKQPIVIQDRVANLSALNTMWFSANFTSQFSMEPSPDGNQPVWIRNKYKLIAIQAPTDSGCELLLAPAKTNGTEPTEDTTIIAIQLAADQIALIPFHMLFSVVNDNKKEVNAIGVHDFVTKFLP